MEENEKSFTQIGLENLRAKTNYNEKIKELSEQEHPLYIQAFFNLRYMNEVSMTTILGNTATDNSVIVQKNNTNDIPHTDKYLGSYRQTGIEYNTIMPLFNLLIPEIKNKFYTNLFNASYNNGELFFGDFPLTPQNIFILLTKFSGVSHNFSNNIFKINFYENSYNHVLNTVFYYLPGVINNTVSGQ